MEMINTIDSFVWGPYFLIPLLGLVGLFMAFRLRFIQIRHFAHAWGLVSGKYDKKDDPGETTHFQALSTALSATVGTGNIAGVATAIAMGGPGALFWMWMTAFFGMAVKYSECLLALKYRRIHEDGSVSGGPMYYITKGLGMKWLGWLFAFFAMIASFGIGNMVQANSVAAPLFDHFQFPKLATGLILAVLTGIVIIGGVKRIASFAEKVVPFMAAVYVIASLAILIMNVDKIQLAFSEIFFYAFNPHAAVGGFAGSTIALTMRFGIARGIFSNESGLGSAPIAHATAKTKEPVREGLVAMLEPFIDTLVICTMTGLVIVISGLWNNGQTGATLSSVAFESTLPGFGQHVVTFGLVLFAYTTLVGWSYYGDRSTEFIFGEKSVKWYRLIYVIMIPVGATTELHLIWNLSDIANGLMALPNLIGLLLLSGVVVKETKDYFSRSHTV